ncbi:Sister-chromatid cohesion protein 3 [Linum perenne]
MLVEACGAKHGSITNPNDWESEESVAEAVNELVKQDQVENHQKLKKKDFSIFRGNIELFWKNLTTQCFDGPLFDKCTSFIIAMSCTSPRVYRQVASLMGLELVTLLITIPKKNRSLTIHGEKMMKKIFTELFHKRCRDIDSNIRMSCIESLGKWILSYLAYFLQNAKLEYLWKALHDKMNAGVRKTSILTLEKLYAVEHNVPTLHQFFGKKSNTFIKFTSDKNVSVAVSAIRLVKKLLWHGLLPDNLDQLYDLLFNGSEEIRYAVGELVYSHLVAKKSKSSQPRTRGGGEVFSSKVHLQGLLEFLRKYKDKPICIVYVIDSVWKYMKAMQDWDCIVSMLLDKTQSNKKKKDKTQEKLADVDAKNLLRLLLASIRKAAGERIVPSSNNREQCYTKLQRENQEQFDSSKQNITKEMEQFDSSKQNITKEMVKNYPCLLKKFVDDKSNIPSLVETVLYMPLQYYSPKRMQESFKSLLEVIVTVFFQHEEREALRSCVKALVFCLKHSEGTLTDFPRKQLESLEAKLIDELKTALKDGNAYANSFLVNLKRLYELQWLKTVPLESLFDDFVRTLQHCRTRNNEVSSYLLLNMYLHVAWSLEAEQSKETSFEEAPSSLPGKRDTLFTELEYFLSDEFDDESYNELVCRVCTILSDTWCIFRSNKFSSTHPEGLGYCPELSVIELFWKRRCEKQLMVETSRDAIIIACANLVYTDTVSNEQKKYLCPQIISHFVMHGTRITDVIKRLIDVIKKRGDDIPWIFLEALKMAYGRYMLAVGEPVRNKTLQDCKDLAAQISRSFVGEKEKHKLIIIVDGGINYAFSEERDRNEGERRSTGKKRQHDEDEDEEEEREQDDLLSELSVPNRGATR